MSRFSQTAKNAGRGLILAAAVLAAPVVIFNVTGCTANSGTSSEKSLYDRLGGEATITVVVSEFVDRAATDPAVNFTRAGVAGAPKWDPTPENVAILKKHLTQFICMATGGPQKYEGRPNKEVHTGMKITDAEFNAIAGDLVAVLNNHNVPQADQTELINVVKTTYGDVVGQ